MFWQSVNIVVYVCGLVKVPVSLQRVSSEIVRQTLGNQQSPKLSRGTTQRVIT